MPKSIRGRFKSHLTTPQQDYVGKTRQSEGNKTYAQERPHYLWHKGKMRLIRDRQPSEAPRNLTSR